MAVCVGCGLEVNNGILEAQVCDNSGLQCNPDCGLDVRLCAGGGLVIDPACGLKVEFPPDGDPIFPPNPGGDKPPQLGCGLNTDGTGKLLVDLDSTIDCGTTVKNGLVCDDTEGLAFPWQSSIAGNSGVCAGVSVDRAYEFLLPPASASDINTPTQFGPGTYFWHTDTWQVGPDCLDPQYQWSGITVWDMGNVFFDVSAGGRVQAVAEISQGYSDGPINFGASPPQWQIFDNRANAVRTVYSFQSHDTTWQVISGGQKFLFQMRMRVEVLDGNVIVGTVKGGGIWEVNWHYSPVFGTGFAGCVPGS